MIRNLIQGFVALATAAKEGLPLVPLWTLSAHPSITLNPSNHNRCERKHHESTSMCKHGLHFIHEMNYSSIAYFLGVMTGKGVKREIAVWSWQDTRPDLVFHALLMGGQINYVTTPGYDLETLLYQATMPGFDEEPMFRGVLLFCISLAIVSKRYSLASAPINIGGLLLVLLFGLVHGVMFSDGEWYFSFTSILLTGGYGFILLWLRERTGSLVFPIIAHNSVNVVGQLI